MRGADGGGLGDPHLRPRDPGPRPLVASLGLPLDRSTWWATTLAAREWRGRVGRFAAAYVSGLATAVVLGWLSDATTHTFGSRRPGWSPPIALTILIPLLVLVPPRLLLSDLLRGLVSEHSAGTRNGRAHPDNAHATKGSRKRPSRHERRGRATGAEYSRPPRIPSPTTDLSMSQSQPAYVPTWKVVLGCGRGHGCAWGRGRCDRRWPRRVQRD